VTATPTQPAGVMRVRNSATETSGVRTTQTPVIKPVAETVVRSKPAGLQNERARDQQSCEKSGDDPARAEQRTSPRTERKKSCARDPQAKGEKRDQWIRAQCMLDLYEGHAPDCRDGDQSHQ
jgi:hypothetical protein